MEGMNSESIPVLKSRLKDVVSVAQLRVILTAPQQQPAAIYDGGSHLCYHVMGLVHRIWAPVPGGIKDYIATPKSNGYRVSAQLYCCQCLASPLVIGHRGITRDKHVSAVSS